MVFRHFSSIPKLVVMLFKVLGIKANMTVFFLFYFRLFPYNLYRTTIYLLTASKSKIPTYFILCLCMRKVEEFLYKLYSCSCLFCCLVFIEPNTILRKHSPRVMFVLCP